MPARAPLYRGYGFPAAIIGDAVWLSHRLALSHRGVEALPAERGVRGSDQAIRLRCRKFGPLYAQAFRRRHPRPGDTWHVATCD